MPINEDTGGWSKSQRWVESELDRLNAQNEKIFEKLEAIGKDVVAIKTEQRVRGGMFGVAGGAISAVLIKALEMIGAK